MGLTNTPTTALSPQVVLPSYPQGVSCKIAYEGLLKYRSKRGQWKERWFVLDATEYRLVKCKPPTGEKPLAIAQGRSSRDAQINEVRGLSTSALEGDSSSGETGLEVVTSTGKHIHFLTSSRDEEQRWLGAAQALSFGFTRGVADRLADRELLAGKYALVRELGRGASGIVSLYTYQGKPHAVKKFVPQKAKGIPNRLAVPSAGARPGLARPPAKTQAGGGIPEDVRREIALLKKASHLPYVIKLHDVIANTDEQQFYLVMEYMGGGAIAEWDAERKSYAFARHQKSPSLLDEKLVRTYMTHLLLGVQALHQNGLCHRDIKPENLMANDERTMCKIGDLGIAHYFRTEADGELVEEADPENIALWDITQQAPANSPPSPGRRRAMLKSTKGTYQFLPPEALTGDEFDGFKADIWSIGVTLYALLFGYLPFFSIDLVKLFEKIERDPVVFPASCKDDQAQDLLVQILEKDPEKRVSIEQILEHGWMQRHVDSKALSLQVQALKRMPPLRVETHELGSAVSVLQSRFEQLSRAVRDNSFGDELRREDMSNDSVAVDVGAPRDTTPYVPRPIDTRGVTLPPWMQSDLHVLATQLHFDWCRAKHLNGWVHGAARDDDARVHPLLVPMRDLPEDARQKNVQTAEETLKCVLALGCHVEKETARSRSRRTVGAAGLVPADHVVLTWDLLLVVDLLAENAHEVWAANCVKQGWRNGAVFDTEAKTHPSLKPYMELEEADKVLCRDGVGAVLKSCVCLGYVLSCVRDRQKPKRTSETVVWAS